MTRRRRFALRRFAWVAAGATGATAVSLLAQRAARRAGNGRAAPNAATGSPPYRPGEPTHDLRQDAEDSPNPSQTDPDTLP